MKGKRIAAAWLIWLTAAATAAGFSIGTVSVKLTNARLSCKVTVSGMIPYKVIRALEDGVRIEYSYRFRLRRKIGFFLARDAVIKEKTTTWVLRYKFLTGHYRLINKELNVSMVLKSRAALIKQLLKPFSLPLFSKRLLEKDKDYYLEARVVIRSTKLYPPFSFLSILSHESDWQESQEFVK